jgi:hypothetical protein
MRRALAASALAAVLFSAAAVEAGAASSAWRARSAKSHALGCEVMRAGFIDIRNTTGRTIARGTRIEIVVAVAGGRTAAVKQTVTTKQTVDAGLYHAFAPVPRGATSCSARVSLQRR